MDTEIDGTHILPTGIPALDQLLHRGLPDRRITLVIGGAGAGKSVFSMQILLQAAALGTPGVIVSFEETVREIRENFTWFHWPTNVNLEKGLHVIHAEVDDDFFDAGEFDISGLLASVEAKVAQTGARWVVFDGMDTLLRALQSPRAGLRELLRLRRWLQRVEVAVIITAKEDETTTNSYSQDFAFMPYIADCVIRLRHAMSENVFVRSLQVMKYRGGPSVSTEVPFVIDQQGINIARHDNLRLEHDASFERVPTGIDRLDTLLDGGYLRGSSILVSGAPGTAKTTLGGTFCEAACRRGEKALLVSFDESRPQIVRNMFSVGIDLEPHVKAGLLHIEGLRASAVSAEQHLITIHQLIKQQSPQCLVIDPVSALTKAGGERLAADVTERLVDLAKFLGITTLMTSLPQEPNPSYENTGSHVSTIADTWIALSYRVHGGERNRGLSIIKARGTNHSNQVRELVLSDKGPTLTDVYTAGGDVLMGTARIEQEALEQREIALRAEEYQLQQSTTQVEISETEERIRTLSRELNSRKQRLQSIEQQQETLSQNLGEERTRIHSSRRALRDLGENQ